MSTDGLIPYPVPDVLGVIPRTSELQLTWRRYWPEEGGEPAGTVSRLSPIVRKMRGIIDSPSWISPCEHKSPQWWVDEDGICRCGYCPAIWMVP